MELRKKKETLIQNITYMAIMAAINVVFVLISVLVPFLFFLIVFVLPLTSAIVTIHCKKVYFPIYAVATIGLCMICTMWQIGDTIFYVIPSIISGFLFGFTAEKKVPSFWIITITTLVQIGISYATIPLLNVISGKDAAISFATVFGLGDFKYLNYVVPCFIFFIALAQEIIAYMVIKEELPKFGITLNDPKELPFSLAMAIGGASTLAFAFSFIPYCGPISYLMSLVSLLFTCYAIIYLILERKTLVYILMVASLLASMFTFAFIYKFVTEPLGLVLVNIFFFMIAIIVLINNYLLKPKKEDTIK